MWCSTEEDGYITSFLTISSACTEEKTRSVTLLVCVVDNKPREKYLTAAFIPTLTVVLNLNPTEHI